MKKSRIISKIMLCTLSIFMAFTPCNIYAAEKNTEYGISMSPLNQKIVLVPGETYTGSFNIFNPGSHETDFKYLVTTEPFYVDDKYNSIFDDPQSYNQIVDWTTINIDKGSLSPNEGQEITFTINVPENAPAGGQYMAITVTSDEDTEQSKNSTMIVAKQAMAHVLFAEVAGTSVRKGEVLEANVPGFLLNGNISGTSSIKNTGNVHSTATYKLQVFPLFSDEELYTNEEDPQTKTILPDRTLVNTTYWNNTPTVGIFNVVYTAEFEGVTTQVKKMVIVCPIWLLAIIIFVVLLIIFWIIAKARSKKKK